MQAGHLLFLPTLLPLVTVFSRALVLGAAHFLQTLHAQMEVHTDPCRLSGNSTAARQSWLKAASATRHEDSTCLFVMVIIGTEVDFQLCS